MRRNKDSLKMMHSINNKKNLLKHDSSRYIVYYVNHGDIVENIASRFKMTVEKLLRINQLFMKTIFLNQKLLVKRSDDIEMNILNNYFPEGIDDSARIEMTSRLMENDEELQVTLYDNSEDVEWEIIKSLDFKEIMKTDNNSIMNFSVECEEVSSKILDSLKINELMKHLPCETVGSTWHLDYSTNRDGWSLGTLYRNVENSTNGCSLLVIEDGNSRIFGALCNTHIRTARSFYGNWLTFVFRWAPNFEKFSYSEKYAYFLYGNKNFFSIGSPKSAIRIESNLFRGSSQECITFDSPSLSQSEYFDILQLEVWSFD